MPVGIKGFQKGFIPWNKNKECPQISIALMGRIPWNRGKIGVQIPSEETRKKMSEAKKGKMPKNIELIRNWFKGKKLSKERIEKMKGRKLSIDTKNKISQSKKGKPTWNKGISQPWSEARRLAQEKVVYSPRSPRSPRKVIVGGKEYPEFWAEIRKDVYIRDKWVCQECGIKCHGNGTKDRIQCHHIDYDINNIDKNNLITLCASCHCKTNFNKEDWQEYFQSIERTI